MTICEFCIHSQKDGRCALGLDIPKRMGCREFDPSIERFCANPADFTGANQIIQMAAFFGIKGMEMRKVKLLAHQEEKSRSEAPALRADAPGSGF